MQRFAKLFVAFLLGLLAVVASISPAVATRSMDAPTPPSANVPYTYDASSNTAELTSVASVAQASASGPSVASPGDPSALQLVFVAADSLAGLSSAEQGVASGARSIYSSKALGEIRAAHAAGTSAEVTVNGTTILYEPGMAESGMTLFGENGFVIGRGAFASDSELAKTIAHESYRLATSASSGGVSGGLAKAETDAAFNFANRVGPYVMGGP